MTLKELGDLIADHFNETDTPFILIFQEDKGAGTITNMSIESMKLVLSKFADQDNLRVTPMKED